MSRLRLSVWLFLEDKGDGSVCARVFGTEDDAEKYAARGEDAGYDRHEGDIQRLPLIFDVPLLLNPDV